jgi:hypothetical protein
VIGYRDHLHTRTRVRLDELLGETIVGLATASIAVAMLAIRRCVNLQIAEVEREYPTDPRISVLADTADFLSPGRRARA